MLEAEKNHDIDEKPDIEKLLARYKKEEEEIHALNSRIAEKMKKMGLL